MALDIYILLWYLFSYSCRPVSSQLPHTLYSQVAGSPTDATTVSDVQTGMEVQ